MRYGSSRGTALAPSPQLDTRFARAGRLTTRVYDDFSRYTDQVVSGLVPTAGNPWQVTGAQPPTVAGGKAASSGIGYLIQTLAARPAVMLCEVTFTGTDPSAQSMTMAACLNDNTSGILLDDFVHFNFGPYGFNATVRRNGGSFDPLIIGSWRSICRQDGASVYRFGMLFRGDTVVFIGPNGEQWAIADPRVSQAAGATAFWEPNTVTGGAAQVVTATAMTAAAAGLTTGSDTALDRAAGFDKDNYDRSVGSQRGYGEVGVGRSPNSDMPSVGFGPARIHTFLTAAASSGATSLTLAGKIPAGSTIQIDSGTATETVTAGPGPSSGTSPGPYPRTLTAGTAVAHPAGTAVIATVPAGRGGEMYCNLENGFFYLPNLPVLIFPGQKAYLGSSLDAFIERKGSDLMGPGAGDSWQVDGTWNGGTFRLGNYYLWVDGAGSLRIKNGAPSSATDGTVVGTQS